MSQQQKLCIGQYHIIKTIGTGSFGKVKLAVHSVTNQKVALKFINRKKIATMDMSGRVKREIQYLKLLRHPHIIKLYEVITTATDIIMVIEYASRELFNYIVERGKMSEDDARRFFQQIICAVEYCHRHKIVHRDLKPENLLLDANNNVKIADFGLSNIMTDGDFLKTSCGSPNYAAPEVISGKLYAGPEVDVWSCGVILYVMLCGRLPFDDEYIPNLFKKINGGIYTMPSFLSPETKYLLTSMLVVDPLKRITIPEIRQNPWFNKNLPAYLQPLPQTDEECHQPIDGDIVQELHKKMGYTTEAINRALKDPGNNPLKVAYQLVLDHKRMLQGSQKTDVQSFFATSPPPWNTAFDDRMTNQPVPSPSPMSTFDLDKDQDLSTSSISVLSSSLPKNDLASNNLPAPPHLSADSSQRRSASVKKPNKSTSRSRWHFGIRSKCPAWEVMLEIYRSLKNVGMVWCTLDTYHLRCRYVYEDLGILVKFDLQLYRLENSSYLVDFKNASVCTKSKDVGVSTSGDVSPISMEMEWHGPGSSEQHMASVYPFLDVCSKLINDIVHS
ncbi:Pkinase-domain-containing protein [Hesseltinella vesiculosa]|uniref:non-specific serine/threonine protein kinase n=1 Tax=Hesseltinella vesiculosa TaxID=101127 RepID=A0A1X2GDC6_9FUNG|nr:Pkinase-domain-containing protein [Hesseltinella vesiculosa]